MATMLEILNTTFVRKIEKDLRALRRLERDAAEEAHIARQLRSPGLTHSYAAEAARVTRAAQ